MYNHHGQTLYTPVFPTAGKSNPLAKSLSHLHLALATIPAELAPPSRPSSPGSRARRQHSYDNVRAAYNAAGGRTSHTSWSRVYRLVDMTCTRSRFKKFATRVERKGPEKDAPWILAETEEEWDEWEKAREKLKSKLRRTDTMVVDQQGHPSASGTSSKQVNLRDKVTSWKAQIDRSFHEDEDIVREPKSSNPETTKGSQPSSTKKRVSPLDFPVVKPSTLKAQTDAKAKGKAKQTNSKPATKTRTAPQVDLDGRKSTAAEDLPVSTPDANRQLPYERKQDMHKSASITPSFPRAVPPKKRHGAPDDPYIRVDVPPASSPLKTGTSRFPLFGLTTPESQEAQRAAAKKRFRIFSSPTAGDEPANSDLQSAKRQKMMTSPPRAARPVSPTSPRAIILATPTKRQGVFGSGLPTSRAKKTPVRPLGAAAGFEDEDDVGVMGRITPKKRERSLTPLLASSHKVMLRSRPPLGRSSPLKNAPFESEVGEELAPHGSPKAYFSSPATSTSSTSALGKNSGSPSVLALDDPNPNFTINPETFVPLFTSTQNGPEGDGSGGGRALSRKGTGHSPALFKYSSQFDVDKNVEDAMALLEKDVDIDNWFVDLGGDVDLAVGASD